MSDSQWIAAEYAYGWVGHRPAILRRGGDFYKPHLSVDQLPWRPCANFTDSDDGDLARRCVVALNAANEGKS